MVTRDMTNFILNEKNLNDSIVNDNNYNNFTSVINMNTFSASSSSITDISDQASTINFNIEKCNEDNINKKPLNSYNSLETNIQTGNKYLNLNHRSSRFDTVSLSALDNNNNNNGKTLKDRMLKVYKTKLINRFTTSRNRNMERLVNKNGEANINRVNIESRRKKYISDLFNTIVDMKWTNILIVFLMSFILSWTFFATIWYLSFFFINFLF